jgi:hypothetical protein
MISDAERFSHDLGKLNDTEILFLQTAQNKKELHFLDIT